MSDDARYSSADIQTWATLFEKITLRLRMPKKVSLSLYNANIICLHDFQLAQVTDTEPQKSYGFDIFISFPAISHYYL